MKDVWLEINANEEGWHFSIYIQLAFICRSTVLSGQSGLEFNVGTVQSKNTSMPLGL